MINLFIFATFQLVSVPQIEPSSVTLPLNLPSHDIDELNLANVDKKTNETSQRKSDTRRSSLASQVKLTRIVEESEHEASTPSANSSKEIATRVTETENEDDGSESEEEVNEEEDDDFDSECSVMSDLEPKIEELIEQFRNETRALVSETELTFYDLENLENNNSESDAINNVVFEISRLAITQEATEKSLEPKPEDPKRLAIRCEITKLSSVQEMKLNSVEQSEEVLSQVQNQLSEIKKSIKVNSTEDNSKLNLKKVTNCIIF
jgi:hypothetical protein